MKKIIGITGGVGSGKTTIVNILKDKYHARVLITDKIAHEAYAPDSEIYKKIVEKFGKKILKANDEIDHTALARELFASEENTEFINSLVHPYVLDRLRAEIEHWRVSDEPLLIIETALMFDTGCDALCDEVWCVTADREIRIERLMKSRDYSREKAEKIISAQLSDDEIEKKCTHIIKNNASVEALDFSNLL